MRVWLARICRMIVACLLVWAALAKSFDIDAFARTVGDFGLVWAGWEFAAVVATIAAESVAGVLLFLHRPTGYALAATLLVAFTFVIVYGMSIGLDIECGCLGAADRWAGVTLRDSLVRNLVLVAALAVAWRLGRLHQRPEARP